MSRFAAILSIGVLVGAALAPLCWAAGNKVVSGRELLRVVRERDRGARRPPREVRIARGKVQADSPDAKEVLRRFAEARKNLTSFIVEMEGETTFDYPAFSWRGKRYTKNDVRFDGARGRISANMWGDINIAYPNVSKDQPQYISRLWDGENLYSYGQRTKISEPDMVTMSRSKDPKGIRKEYTSFVQESMVPGLWMGYNRGDNGKRIDEVFGSAEHLELRQENLGGVDCYVIDAAVKGKSKYTL